MVDIIAHMIIGLLLIIIAAMLLQVLIKDCLYSNESGKLMRILMGTFLTIVMMAFTSAASFECTLLILKIAHKL